MARTCATTRSVTSGTQPSNEIETTPRRTPATSTPTTGSSRCRGRPPGYRPQRQHLAVELRIERRRVSVGLQQHLHDLDHRDDRQLGRGPELQRLPRLLLRARSNTVCPGIFPVATCGRCSNNPDDHLRRRQHIAAAGGGTSCNADALGLGDCMLARGPRPAERLRSTTTGARAGGCGWQTNGTTNSPATPGGAGTPARSTGERGQLPHSAAPSTGGCVPELRDPHREAPTEADVGNAPLAGLSREGQPVQHRPRPAAGELRRRRSTRPTTRCSRSSSWTGSGTWRSTSRTSWPSCAGSSTPTPSSRSHRPVQRRYRPQRSRRDPGCRSAAVTHRSRTGSRSSRRSWRPTPASPRTGPWATTASAATRATSSSTRALRRLPLRRAARRRRRQRHRRHGGRVRPAERSDPQLRQQEVNGPDMRFSTLEDIYGPSGDTFQGALGFRVLEGTTTAPAVATSLGVDGRRHGRAVARVQARRGRDRLRDERRVRLDRRGHGERLRGERHARDHGHRLVAVRPDRPT